MNPRGPSLIRFRKDRIRCRSDAGIERVKREGLQYPTAPSKTSISAAFLWRSKQELLRRVPAPFYRSAQGPHLEKSHWNELWSKNRRVDKLLHRGQSFISIGHDTQKRWGAGTGFVLPNVHGLFQKSRNRDIELLHPIMFGVAWVSRSLALLHRRVGLCLRIHPHYERRGTSINLDQTLRWPFKFEGIQNSRHGCRLTHCLSRLFD